MDRLFLPSGAYKQLQNEKYSYLLDELRDAVVQAAGQCVAVANAEGGRLMTAGGFMLRANSLLQSARAVEAESEACALALRSVIELSIMGRYFVVGPDAADEFAKAIRKAHESETKLAIHVGLRNAPLPPPLQDAAARASGKPKSLSDLAEGLDVADGMTPGDPGSLVYFYRLWYQVVSNTLTHANPLSTKDYVSEQNGVLHLHDGAGRSLPPNVIAIACLLCELAADLLGELNVSIEALPKPLLQRRATNWSVVQP